MPSGRCANGWGYIRRGRASPQEPSASTHAGSRAHGWIPGPYGCLGAGVTYEKTAVAFTDAPETARAFAPRNR